MGIWGFGREEELGIWDEYNSLGYLWGFKMSWGSYEGERTSFPLI